MKKIALIVFLVAGSAYAQTYGLLQFQLNTAQGQAVAGATVTVYSQATCGAPAGAQAVLYPAATGGTPLTQPLTTNGFGYAFAYAAQGCYTVVFYSQYTGTLTYPDQNSLSASYITDPVLLPNNPFTPTNSGASAELGLLGPGLGFDSPSFTLTATQQVPRAQVQQQTTSGGTFGTSFNAAPTTMWNFVGNSLVAIDVGTAGNFAPGLLSDTTMKGTPSRLASSATCASGVCTITVPNSDGMFQIGKPFTPVYNPAFDSGCLADTQYPTSVSSTSVTFSTATSWPGPCADIGATAYTTYLIPNYVRFGLNGSTLNAWFSSTGNYGFSALKTQVQAQIAAGQYPVVDIVDGCLATNDLRQYVSATPTLTAHLAECKTVIAAIEAISATGPDGVVRSMQDFTIIAENGTPYAALYTSNGLATGTPQDSGTFISTQYQYICPPGGTVVTPAFCSDGYVGGAAPVTTSGSFSAGANTVTLNFCDPMLWPGYGISPSDFYSQTASGLTKDGTPMMVDLVDGGSSEWVQVTSIIPTTGSANGFPACQLSFTAANNHSASIPVMTGNNTAGQVLSSLRTDITKTMATWYPNIQVVDTATPLSKQIWPPGVYIANQLHPSTAGYIIDHQTAFAALQNIASSGQSALQQPQVSTLDQGELVTSTQSPAEQAFNELAASQARLQLGSMNAGSAYSMACLTDNDYLTVVKLPKLSTAGSGFLRFFVDSGLGSITPLEVQTGDQFYNHWTGCIQPTAITSQTYAAGVAQVNYTGGVNYATAGPGGILATGPFIVRRPKFVSPVGAAYAHAHPGIIQTTILGTVQSASTTNSLVFSLATTQPNGDLNVICSNLSVQLGDYLNFAGSSTVTQLGAGTITASGQNCVWTDTSGTNYSTFNGLQMNFFELNRSADKSFANLNSATSNATLSNAIAGFNANGTSQASTPTVPTVTGASSCAAANYWYKVSLVPVGNTAAQDGPASAFAECTISSSSAQFCSVRNIVIPPGYTANVYGRPATSGGTYGLIGSGVPASGSTGQGTFNDLCTVSPGAAPHSSDNSVTGNVPSATGLPGATNYVCTSTSTVTNKCTWSAQSVPLTGTTGTITGTALTATCDSGTASVTGAVVGHPVGVSSTTGADVGGAFNLRASVTSSNTVTVYICGTGTPPSLAYNVTTQ